MKMSSQTSEYVGENIIKIVDSKGSFYGTGFVIDVKEVNYCITCHHCICELDAIYIQKNNQKYPAEWIEEFSDMKSDFAVLNVKDCDNINVKPLLHAKQAMPKLSVLVWGFSSTELETFPQGSPVEGGQLSSNDFRFEWKEEDVKGNEKWNKKPLVNVRVFRFSGKFDVGYSGAPVCYEADSNVIGVFTAKDNNYGYIIPIQFILEKFDIKTLQPSSAVDMDHFLTKGNEYFVKGDYSEAIKQYEVVINNRNYINALYNKGSALSKLGQEKEALACFDKVLVLDAFNIDVLHAKGYALSRLGRYKEAKECFDMASAFIRNV